MIPHNLANNVQTTVEDAVASDATSLTVAASIAVEAPFKATFADNNEIIEVGAIDGAAWSEITRGAEGTIATSHAAGARVELRVTAGHLEERRPFNVYPSDDAATNTANIRAAIAQSHYVSLAPGTYRVARTASESAIFEMPGRTEINGNGSTVILAAGTPNTVDLFLFRPTFYTHMCRIHNMWIKPEVAGEGRHGVHFQTQASPLTGFINLGLHDMVIGAHSGHRFGSTGICVTNPGDGFCRSFFRDSQIYGQVRIDGAGDSTMLEGLHVNNMLEYGVTAIDIPRMTALAGLLTIRDCNIIGGGGSIRAVFASIYNHCKIENVDSDYVTSTQAPQYPGICSIYGGENVTIRDSRFNSHSGAYASHGIYLDGTTKATVICNQVNGTGTGKGIYATATCVDSYGINTSSNTVWSGSVTNLGSTRAAI